MSIASRITSIEGHIGDIYDTLELGGDTTQNKNLVNINTEIKREYKDFLANGTEVLWNNWEKVSGSGTSIFLSNTIKAPMKTNLKGNTSQNGTPTPSSPVEVKTTTGRQEIDVRGKNLLPFPYFTTSSPFTNNGITYTINNDGTITVNGTATGRSSMPLYGNYLVENQKDLTGKYIKGGTSNVNMYVFAHVGNQYPVLAQDTGQGAEIDKSNYQKGYIELVVTNGTTVNNELIKPMMLNSLDDTTYEEYKLQSYEINLGKNLWRFLSTDYYNNQNVSSWNILSLNKLQVTSTNGTYANVKYKLNLPDGTYTFKLGKVTNSNSNMTKKRMTLAQYVGSNISVIQHMDEGNSYTININNSQNDFYCIEFWATYETAMINTATFEQIQIEKGSVATSYAPYKQSIELCKIGTYQDRILKNSGKNLFNKEDVVDGYYINDYGEFVQRSDLFYSNFISVKPNTKYVNSGKSSWTVTALYNANKEFISRPTYNAITTTNETYYIRVIGLISEKDRIMLEEGSTPTLYEPFGSGKWYLEKQIGKVMINGSENWSLNTSSPRRFTITNANLNITNIKDGTSQLDTQNYRINTHFRWNIGGLGNVWGLYYWFNGYLVLSDNDSSIADLNTFKTWLSNNNPKLYYVLATPTTNEITDYELINQLNELEKAKSYENQTNINQIADLPFELDVVALKGE